MKGMILKGLGCRTPPESYSQADCLAILRGSEAFGRLKSRSRLLLEKVLSGENGIDSRHFAMPGVEGLFDLGAGELNRGFEREAPALASAALGDALEKAGVLPGDVDALLVCTCTGYLCPGVSSYVAERMGMRPDVFLGDMVGLGCGAAIPTLRQASALVREDPGMTVACVAVEICSAAFYLDDDPGVLISLCLFGDGAAATVWSGGEAAPDDLRCDGFDTLHLPEKRDLLRFENAGGKLRNRLHRSVPEHAAAAVKTLFDRNGQPDAAVIAHAGGRDVIDEVARSLDRTDLPDSRSVLRDCGNMSSPSVLFSLDAHLAARPTGPLRLWGTSFGAGFACHSCRFTRG